MSPILAAIKNKLGYVIWLLCAIFFLYEFLLRTIVGTFQHPIMYDLKLNTFTFSLISSTAYMVIYGAMQIPVGVLLDKYGLKKIISTACLICALATFGLAYTYSLPEAFFYRILMGLGSSFGFISLLVAVYDWLPKSRIAFFIGLSQFIGVMGPMLASGPIEHLSQLELITWRSVFLYLFAFGLVLSILMFFIVKNNRERQEYGYTYLRTPETTSSNLLKVIRDHKVWYIALYSALSYFFIEYFSENQGKYFLTLHGYNKQQAANLLSVSWLGYAISCPVLGFISDKIRRRKLIMIIASVILTLAITLIVFTNLPVVYAYIVFLLLGVGASGQSIGFVTIAERCKEHYVALGLSFNNMLICAMSAINAPILGYLFHLIAETSLTELRQQQLILIIPIMLAALSIYIATFKVRENYARNVVQPIKITGIYAR